MANIDMDFSPTELGISGSAEDTKTIEQAHKAVRECVQMNCSKHGANPLRCEVSVSPRDAAKLYASVDLCCTDTYWFGVGKLPRGTPVER